MTNGNSSGPQNLTLAVVSGCEFRTTDLHKKEGESLCIMSIVFICSCVIIRVYQRTESSEPLCNLTCLEKSRHSLFYKEKVNARIKNLYPVISSVWLPNNCLSFISGFICKNILNSPIPQTLLSQSFSGASFGLPSCACCTKNESNL